MAIGRGKTGLEAIADAITELAESMLMLSIATLSNQLKNLGQSAKIPTIDDLIDKLEKLQKSTSKNSNAISDAEKESGSSLKKIVANYMNTTGMVGQGLSGLARGAMLPLAAATGVFAAAASGAIQEIANFVAKANPSTYFQFNRALDDLAGTLGQILTPVLEGVTVFIRTFADVLQGMRPTLEPIMLSIKAIIIEMSRLIEPLASILMPTFQLLAFTLENIVVPAVTDLVDVLGTVAKAVTDAVETISFGLVNLRVESKSSVGAAIRPAAYSKGVEDVGKRTTLAALNQSDKNDTGKKIDTTNGLLSKILEKIGVEKDTRGWIDRNKGRVAAGVVTLGVSELIRGIRDL